MYSSVLLHCANKLIDISKPNFIPVVNVVFSKSQSYSCYMERIWKEFHYSDFFLNGIWLWILHCML